MELETQTQLQTAAAATQPRSLPRANPSRSAGLESAPSSFISARVPVAFGYQDYRKFLKDWFAWKKEVQPRFSGAVFAKKAGLGSAALLGMVIRGDRNLGYETIRAFIHSLGLKGREKIYFEKLVLFNQSKKSEDRADFFEQLITLSQGSGSGALTKLKDYARYLSRWYIVVIRELVLLPEFQASPEWISQKLKKKITKREAEAAWSMLLALGMVKQNPNTGRFEQTEASLEIDPGSVDFVMRGFYKDFLNRIQDAIDGESLDERELSSLTLAVSEEDLSSLKKKLNDLRKHLNLIYSKKPGNLTPSVDSTTGESAQKHVISLHMQLLVLTEGLTAGSGKNPKQVESRTSVQEGTRE